jgi:molybdate transport system ATP-binding protein
MHHPDKNSGLRVRIRQQTHIPLDAELACGSGDLLALVGPSGSGKSTLLRCIAGLYRPAWGSIICSGRIWLDTDRHIDRTPQQRRVGFLFQDFALFPHLSVLDNVSLALRDVAKSERKAAAADLLERVNLDGFEDRLPTTLSGGQQQRAALARALARRPEILLLDEPFSAVDQVTRRKLRLEMMQLVRQVSLPIVLVTHDLDEACMLADSMCVLHGGKTYQQGTPREILERPNSANVARLVDVRNLFEGRVIEHLPERGITRLAWEGYQLEAAYAKEYAGGDRVWWCIPPTGILLHSRLRPSKGEKENAMQGHIIEIVRVGAVTNLIVQVSRTRSKLHMDCPPHVVTRNALQVGEHVGVSLLQRSIHIMPWQS